MAVSQDPISLPSIPLLFFSCFLVWLPMTESVSDYTTLIYKTCTNHTPAQPIQSYSQTLSSLLQTLAANSLHSNFFKASAADDYTAIFGLFQCRGELSSANCYNCVSSLPALSKTLCGESLAARIQLSGCYIQYEADGVPENPELELVYKVCSEREERGSGFEEMRDEAFGEVERGVMVSGNGLYEEKYEMVKVMGECRRDMESCECGECVSRAVEIAKEECKSSVAGEIYMGNCYLSYSFNPEKPKGGETAKTVAIVVGAGAALVFGFFFLKLIQSWVKRGDDL